MIEINSPNITSEDQVQTLLQMRSYLYQLSGQLNWAFSTLEHPDGTSDQPAVERRSTIPQTSESQDDMNKWGDLKGLIIKSADIVDAYYDVIKTRLNEVYVAVSEFGTYKEQVSREITQTAKGTVDSYQFDSKIGDAIEKIGVLTQHIDGMIRSGVMEDESGNVAVGIAIGQDIVVERDSAGNPALDKDGRQIIKRENNLAFYRADGIYFYVGGYEAAHLTNQQMVIREANITGKLTLNNWLITDDSAGLTVRFLQEVQ